jgi:hypothetical protein
MGVLLGISRQFGLGGYVVLDPSFAFCSQPISISFFDHVLWQSILELRMKRNLAVHGASTFSPEEAKEAISPFEMVVDRIDSVLE